jgi:hypothetical protein
VGIIARIADGIIRIKKSRKFANGSAEKRTGKVGEVE